MLGPLTLIQFVAVFLTHHIKSSGPHAAIAILSSSVAFVTISRISSSIFGRPGRTATDVTEVLESQGLEGPPCVITGVFSRSMGKGSGWRVAKGVVLVNESCFSMSSGEVGEVGDAPSTGDAGEPV